MRILGNMATEVAEAELLQAFRKGDNAAWERLLEAYCPRMYQTALAVLGNPDAARQVTADVVAEARRNRRRWCGCRTPLKSLCALVIDRCRVTP